ncbi:MAG: 23S rRNA (pseudouridine(1915)-N(3))-methyltransferase RlmH [Alphaproteobacteria bacterium]|nr:23S rRNA (pseudouridine(1915)-N(3))-methyltransferase RlmH [Alphaproteobacteria bacterium]
MRLWIAAVGRGGRAVSGGVYEDHARRLTWPLELREVDLRQTMTPEKRKIREAEKLLAAVPEGALLVALDEKGKSLSSREFAQKLGAWRDDGIADLGFLIGGADGLDPSIRKKAALVLSLGPMTWPHLLVRGMLAEQLYRAQSILTGHPYHREG